MCCIKPNVLTTIVFNDKEGQTICQHDFIDYRNTKLQ